MIGFLGALLSGRLLACRQDRPAVDTKIPEHRGRPGDRYVTGVNVGSGVKPGGLVSVQLLLAEQTGILYRAIGKAHELRDAHLATVDAHLVVGVMQ